LTFNMGYSSYPIAWTQNGTGTATVSASLQWTIQPPPAINDSIWAFCGSGKQNVSSECRIGLSRLYIFTDAATGSLPVGAIRLAGAQYNEEDSNTVFIETMNKYGGVYPLPKAIPVNWMSTTDINTGSLTREVQFFLGSDVYNDAATGGATNAPSYINIYVASAYVSPNSTLTNLQVIQRSRQVWLTG
jgi:hypothetical protein